MTLILPPRRIRAKCFIPKRVTQKNEEGKTPSSSTARSSRGVHNPNPRPRTLYLIGVASKIDSKMQTCESLAKLGDLQRPTVHPSTVASSCRAGAGSPRLLWPGARAALSPACTVGESTCVPVVNSSTVRRKFLQHDYREVCFFVLLCFRHKYLMVVVVEGEGELGENYFLFLKLLLSEYYCNEYEVFFNWDENIFAATCMK